MTTDEYLSECNIASKCPICHKVFPEGDIEKAIIHKFPIENVAIQICPHHHVDTSLLQAQRGKNG